MSGKELPRDSDGQLSSYAWPGGYQIVYFTRNGDILCPDCAREAELHATDQDSGDLPIDGLAHWEGEPMICDECYKILESEYGSIE